MFYFMDYFLFIKSTYVCAWEIVVKEMFSVLAVISSSNGHIIELYN